VLHHADAKKNLTYFVYFPWPPLEAALSISTHLSLIYTSLIIRWSSERNYPASSNSKYDF